MVRRLALAFVSVGLLAGPAFAHPGGLDAQGCHHNRKTGDYHCHRGPAPMPAAMPKTTALPAGGVFRNCSEARAAGAAPVRRGEPGYGPHLDRDGDGIGCEPSRGR